MQRNRILGTFTGFLATIAISASAQAASVTVTTEQDTGAFECSLRHAIDSANGNGAIEGCVATGDGNLDTIELPAGNYVLTITGLDDKNSVGDLDILNNLTLNGAGAETTSISAQGLEDNGSPERVLHISPFGEFLNVTINDVTIRDGLEDGDGGGILIESAQAGLLSAKLGVFDGTFTLATFNGVNLVDNESLDDAGGMYNSGAMLIIDNSLISGNISAESGGGIFNGSNDLETRITNSIIDGNTGVFGAGMESEGVILIDSTTISNNAGACVGGGLAVDGSATVINSTINDNRADGDCELPTGTGSFNLGGGIALDAFSSLILVNSTLSGNFAPEGGGGIAMALPVAAPAPIPAIKFGLAGLEGLHLYNVTIAENETDGSGGGILTLVLQSTGTGPNLLTMANSILANNTAADSPDCQADFFSEGYNLVEDTSGCNGFTATGDQTGIDPVLGPLQDNGGPTFTQALLVGSPAIDTANPSGCLDNTGAVLNRDQRGETRPVAILDPNTPICDIGAFEFQIPEPTPSPTPTPTPGFLLNGTGCALVEGAAPAAAPALLFLLAGLGALAYRYRRAE